MMESEQLLERDGWHVECESPFEIRHDESGSFASGRAAQIVVAYLEFEDYERKRLASRGGRRGLSDGCPLHQ